MSKEVNSWKLPVKKKRSAKIYNTRSTLGDVLVRREVRRTVGDF